MITSILRRMKPQRPHLTALAALLVCIFGMTLFLAWQAYDSARSATAQAEETLRGWAALSGANWKEKVETFMYQALAWSMGGVAPVAESADLDPEQVRQRTQLQQFCLCLTPERVRYYFVLDGDGRFQASGVVPDGAREWIDAVVAEAPVAQLGRGIGVGMIATPDRMMPYLRVAGPGAEVARVIGFEAEPGVLDEFLDNVWRHSALLPQAFTAGSVNDSILAVVVTDRDEAVLYRSPATYDTLYSATLRTSAPVPGLDITVSVRPEAADMLLIGGMPRSRLPTLLLLLAVAGGLLVVSLLLIRRELDLARLRADFIAGVSHELRTPLAQIRMFAETLLLGRTRTEGERLRSVEIIDQEARRLAHLVENVLIFAKSERRKSRINPQITNLPADLREAIQAFAVLCRSREIEIRPELQEGVAAPVDRGALRQIVLNLLDNAVKYGPVAQRITVGLALHGDSARIWVDDEGPGVPEAERAAVFDSFYRLTRDVDSPVAGSGIGLAIVRELVLLHGGRVRVEDAPGGGARVVLELPGAYVRPESAAEGWAVA